jgi:Mitochondrial carrier protein
MGYYNQTYDVNSRGVLYTSGMDAFKKLTATEGMKAFYKGFLTHFLRIGPHFCLTFVFLGVLKRNLQ